MLLRSALPLACSAELSGKTLRNLPRHASDACTANPLAGTIFLPCAAHIPVPAPRGLPHPPAAPSLCTAVLVHLCGQPCGHSMTLGISSQSVGELRLCSLRSASGAAAVLPHSNNRRSTLWKLRRTHLMRLRITRGQPALNQAAWKFSFTIFSIVKSQKIVNGTGEILLWGETVSSIRSLAGNSRCASNLR